MTTSKFSQPLFDTGDRQHWTLDDIPFERIDRAAVADDALIFGLVAAASLIEITSDTYTRNLVKFCAADDEVVTWLNDGWQHEEVQHGAALRRYCETAWPDFDWEACYGDFMAEYGPHCQYDLLEPTRALEMVSRCVVETGTASFYRMLSDAAPEPVLRKLAAFISRDEVDHYKHFYRYYRRFAEKENPSRLTVARCLWRRTGAVDAEDASIAIKHVRRARYPEVAAHDEGDAQFRALVRTMAKQHYRFEPAVKMLLRPLELPGIATQVAVPVATQVARRYLFA